MSTTGNKGVLSGSLSNYSRCYKEAKHLLVFPLVGEDVGRTPHMTETPAWLGLHSGGQGSKRASHRGRSPAIHVGGLDAKKGCSCLYPGHICIALLNPTHTSRHQNQQGQLF